MAIGAARRTFIRPVLVTGTTALTLVANLAGLLAGITIVLPHLLYIPIALAGYWYPRRGRLIAAGIAAAYAAMAMALAPSDWVSIATRAVTLVAVGTLIAYLSRRLAAGEERYRGLFDNAVAGILVVGDDGVIRDANPQGTALAGRREGELAGTSFAAIAADPDAATRFLAGAACGPTGHVELDLHRIDGRPLRCLTSGAPLGGGLIVVTLADVTGQYLARSALQSANRTMATLARILDQDLTADLEALDTFLDRERSAVDDPESVALLRHIGEQVGAIARRIAVSREFNALGVQPPAWQPLQDAIDEACTRLDAGPVSIRSWVARLEIYADPALPSALYHLLDNATRPEIGAKAVVISYHQAPDGCRVYVEDDGIGFPADERAALLSAPDRRDRHGLTFVRQALGITGIDIVEEGTGAGARFVLSVPLEGCKVV